MEYSKTCKQGESMLGWQHETNILILEDLNGHWSLELAQTDFDVPSPKVQYMGFTWTQCIRESKNSNHTICKRSSHFKTWFANIQNVAMYRG